MTAHPIIDLHLHTAISDGTDSPAELLEHVREAKLDFFSVTDHDATAACEQIRALLRPGDPRFLFGAEFSCRDALGKYHILAYGYDPAAEPIRALTKQGHEKRMLKLGRRLRLLHDRYGISFREADVEALYALKNPGRPHIANLMVRYGYADSVTQAFVTVLNGLSVPDAYTAPEETVAGILAAGGVPVLAHPCYGDGSQRIFDAELDARVRRMTELGVKGLEGYYSGYTAAHREEVLALARAYGLYVTAGSDCHGRNKPIRIAETGLSENEPLPEGLKRFLSDMFPG